MWRLRGSGLLLCSLLLLQHLLIPVVVGVHSAQVDSQIAKCVAKCGVLSRKCYGFTRSMRRSSGFRAEVGHSSKLVEGEKGKNTYKVGWSQSGWWGMTECSATGYSQRSSKGSFSQAEEMLR